MEKKIYKADMFIIPNQITVEEKEIKDIIHSWWWDRYEKRMSHLFGKEVAEKDKGRRRLVQVWITSPECENWSDHVNNPVDKEIRFPGNLPLWMVGNMKEGETIKIDLPEYNATLELTAQQLKYRYKDYGTFDNVLKQLGA